MHLVLVKLGQLESFAVPKYSMITTKIENGCCSKIGPDHLSQMVAYCVDGASYWCRGAISCKCWGTGAHLLLGRGTRAETEI